MERQSGGALGGLIVGALGSNLVKSDDQKQPPEFFSGGNVVIALAGPAEKTAEN